MTVCLTELYASKSVSVTWCMALTLKTKNNMLSDDDICSSIYEFASESFFFVIFVFRERDNFLIEIGAQMLAFWVCTHARVKDINKKFFGGKISR